MWKIQISTVFQSQSHHILVQPYKISHRNDLKVFLVCLEVELPSRVIFVAESFLLLEAFVTFPNQ